MHLSKGKELHLQGRHGVFLCLVLQQVQVRLDSVPVVSSAITGGFQWHRAAFQNELVFICLLGWHVEQGHICVAKLNFRWSQRGLKEPGISRPLGCPLSVPVCEVLATATYLKVLFHYLLYCCGQNPASSSSWCQSLVPGVSFTPPRCFSDSGSAPAGNKTYCDKHCFPREVFYMAAGSKQCLLRVPQHPILSMFAVLLDSWCPLECLVVCREQLWKQGWLVTLGTLLGAQVLWLADKSQCTLAAGVKWWVHKSKGFPWRSGWLCPALLLLVWSSPAAALVLDLEVAEAPVWTQVVCWAQCSR